MAKTTKANFALFVSECEKWIEIFGLKSWEIKFRHETSRKGSLASCDADLANKVVWMYLSKKWDVKITDKRLKQSGFHEACEILMSPLDINAKARFVAEHEITEARHGIIRTLENVLYPKY